MTYEQRSKARNKRAGGTGTFAGDSAAREARLDAKDNFNKARPGKFVPFDVREGQWRRQGYRGKDAKRMAQFQSSTAGQSMGAGGTMDDPYGGFDTQNQERKSLMPDPIDQPESGGQQASQPQSKKPGMFSGMVSRGLDAIRRFSGVEEGSAQDNFLNRLGQGALNDNEVTAAQDYAKSIGTTFDPIKGYARNTTLGKSYDDTASTGKVASTLPSPSNDGEGESFPNAGSGSELASNIERLKKGPKRIPRGQDKAYVKDQEFLPFERKGYASSQKVAKMNSKDYVDEFEKYMDSVAAYKKKKKSKS